MRDILNSYTSTELRKFISNFNKSLGAVRGYSKMKKGELIDLMTKKEHIGKFKSIKMKVKTERKKPEKKTTTTTTKTTTKTQPKKQTTTTPKEEPKKEKNYEEKLKEEVRKYINTTNKILKKYQEPFKFKSYNEAFNFFSKMGDERNNATDTYTKETLEAAQNLPVKEYNKLFRPLKEHQALLIKEEKKFRINLKKLKKAEEPKLTQTQDLKIFKKAQEEVKNLVKDYNEIIKKDNKSKIGSWKKQASDFDNKFLTKQNKEKKILFDKLRKLNDILFSGNIRLNKFERFGEKKNLPKKNLDILKE